MCVCTYLTTAAPSPQADASWQLPPTVSSVKHVMLQEVQHAEKSPGAASETPWYLRFLNEGMFDIVYRGMQAAVEVMPVCCRVQVQVIKQCLQRQQA